MTDTYFYNNVDILKSVYYIFLTPTFLSYIIDYIFNGYIY